MHWTFCHCKEGAKEAMNDDAPWTEKEVVIGFVLPYYCMRYTVTHSNLILTVLTICECFVGGQVRETVLCHALSLWIFGYGFRLKLGKALLRIWRELGWVRQTWWQRWLGLEFFLVRAGVRGVANGNWWCQSKFNVWNWHYDYPPRTLKPCF